MDIVALIISLLALGFTIFTYYRHDVKIKNQSMLLNQYNLDKIEKEKNEAKKAIIEANLIPKTTGTKILRVYNKGKCIARSVNIIIPDVDGITERNNPSPIDIRPYNSIEILIFLTLSAPDKIEVKFEWSDDSSPTNTDSQIIQI